MSIDVIQRPPRRAAPLLPEGDLPLEAPPAIPQPSSARWQQWLTVLPMLAGTVATALMFGGREGAGAYTYVVGGIFGLSTLGMLVTNWGGGGPRKAELMRARRDYLRYLGGTRHRVRTVIASQREALAHRHPDPQTLWAEAMSRRVWERRPGDADFGVVRVALGPQSLAMPLIAPTIDATADLEPVTAGALRRFLTAYSVVPELPVSIAIRSFARIIVTTGAPPSGPDTDDPSRALVRAMMAQLATFHAPEDLMIAACIAVERRRDWDWLKWLPHALHPTEVDAVGPRRLVVESLAELERLLGELLATRPRFQPPLDAGKAVGFAGRAGEPIRGPQVLVLLDGGDREGATLLSSEDGRAGVTVIDLGGPPPRSLSRSTIALRVGADGVLESSTMDDQVMVGQADRLSRGEAEALARRLAPLRLAETMRPPTPLAATPDLTRLLDIADPATADVGELWRPRPARDVLRIPIGTGTDGGPVYLDLKEAAQDGMGPHGLIVGATGSGKSELLRTLVLGLALTHSPEVLNFVLVDFKGGATFASLDRLPHTSAVITNLSDALPLVDRMKDAMSGELTRRQEQLRRAGNFASVREYDRARAAGADLPPLASLLLVCDEFTEMLVAKPDLIDLFVQIGRIGRSIGVHLLLATQRLEEGRLRGLETNLSYRIALRTFTAHESRMTLGGAADAADLPASPGHGFLRVGAGELQRFTAAYSSGPHRPGRSGPASAEVHRILDYTCQHLPVAVEPAPDPATGPDEPERSLMEVIVSRLAGRGPDAHRVWLPPLHEPPTVDELLGGVIASTRRGLATANPSLWGALQVPVAIVDKPFEQRRDVAWLDLAGSAGHVAVVGNPQSGKSTVIRTLVTGLALTHTPSEIQVYCLDFGGGSLGALRDLPHVGAVAGRLDVALVRRTVGEVSTLLADRERRFAEHRIDSMAAFRRLRRPSDLDATLAVPEDGFGDVFLVVDGWATLRNEFEDLEAVLVDVATRGLGYGIHLVAAATRWTDFRSNIKDLFGSRVELRLGDPADSMVSRKAAANVPAATPGRAIVAEGLQALTALPRAGTASPAALVEAVVNAWTGPPAPPIRMLPAALPYSTLLTTSETGSPVPVGAGLVLPIGIAEADLRPVMLDFGADPHLIAFGDSECGKSSLLRCLADTVARRFTPAQARIVLVDYRRSLLGAVSPEHLIGYGTSTETAIPLLESVASYMERRRPGPDITPEQLRDRSWWEGPECFVLVDDYDLVATGPTNPLAPLLEYLAQARDVGLHLVLTRRAGGAARALYEPVLQRLRELGTPGLVMSGDRDEGVLIGTVRPGPLPAGRGWLVTRREGARLVQLALPAPA